MSITHVYTRTFRSLRFFLIFSKIKNCKHFLTLQLLFSENIVNYFQSKKVKTKFQSALAVMSVWILLHDDDFWEWITCIQPEILQLFEIQRICYFSRTEAEVLHLQFSSFSNGKTSWMSLVNLQSKEDRHHVIS